MSRCHVGARLSATTMVTRQKYSITWTILHNTHRVPECSGGREPFGVCLLVGSSTHSNTASWSLVIISTDKIVISAISRNWVHTFRRRLQYLYCVKAPWIGLWRTDAQHTTDTKPSGNLCWNEVHARQSCALPTTSATRSSIPAVLTRLSAVACPGKVGSHEQRNNQHCTGVAVSLEVWSQVGCEAWITVPWAGLVDWSSAWICGGIFQILQFIVRVLFAVSERMVHGGVVSRTNHTGTANMLELHRPATRLFV